MYKKTPCIYVYNPLLPYIVSKSSVVNSVVSQQSNIHARMQIKKQRNKTKEKKRKRKRKKEKKRKEKKRERKAMSIS